MKPLAILAALICVIGLMLAALWPALTRNPDDLGLRALAERSGQTYVYGYPLVLTDVTRQALLARSEAPAVNTLYHRRERPAPEDRLVVRPNLDTLYTLAFLDLSEGPVVLSLPDFGERDWMFQVLDAWTVVAGAPSQRVDGSGPLEVRIAGPDTPVDGAGSDSRTMRVPTRTAWLIGRIALAPDEPLAPIHALQDGVHLSGGRAIAPPEPIPDLPPHHVAEMSAETFFTRMAAILEAASADPGARDTLRPLGYGAENAETGPLAQWAINKGVEIARQRLKDGLRNRPYGPTNWRTLREGIGVYGDDYALRAGVAVIGLGANRAEDAIYPNTDIDSEGASLNGDNRYEIRFEPDQLPPVDAFWSVTVYDAEGYLIMEAPDERRMIHGQSDLAYDPDGGLTLTFSAHPPEVDTSNWLPIPQGEPFAITARLYSPQPSALSGAWEMPPVRRMD